MARIDDIYCIGGFWEKLILVELQRVNYGCYFESLIIIWVCKYKCKCIWNIYVCVYTYIFI